MRILVTGGAGYLGSVLVPKLLACGHEVTVLDALVFRQFSLAGCCSEERFRFVQGDVRDEPLVRELLGETDGIIPLAAMVGAPLCDRDPSGAMATNREAIGFLCKESSRDQIIILPVTNSGYGIGEQDRFCTEDSPLRPISLYGRTKVEAESIVLDRGNSLSLRLATVFGMSPRMRLDLLVNDFVYRAFKDRFVVVFEGHFKRNFLHIQDACGAFLHAIQNFETMKGRPYNVGLDDANLSKLELCERIRGHFPEFVTIEAPIGEDPDKRDYIVSNARIAATGFRTHWDLDRGIAELKRGYPLLPPGSFSNV